MTNPDLERLLFLQNNADTPELRIEYRQLKEKIERALEIESQLMTQIYRLRFKNKKLRESLHNPNYEFGYKHIKAEDFDNILQNQRTDQDKQNEKIVDEIRKLHEKYIWMSDKSEQEERFRQELQSILGEKK